MNKYRTTLRSGATRFFPLLPPGPDLVMVLLALGLCGWGLAAGLDFGRNGPVPRAEKEYWVESSRLGAPVALFRFDHPPGPADLARAAGIKLPGGLEGRRFETPVRVRTRPGGGLETRPLSGAASLCLGLKMDLGSASARDLALLPGVGPVTARRILAARSRRPFSSLDDLRRVPGLGPEAVRRLARWALVPARPQGRP